MSPFVKASRTPAVAGRVPRTRSAGVREASGEETAGGLDAAVRAVLWQKNHLEACYCLEGEGTVEELDSGTVHEIKPGTLYAMNQHDRRKRPVFPTLMGL